MRKIQSASDYIEELREGKKGKPGTIIGRRSKKCLALMDERDLRRIITRYRKEARIDFKDPAVEEKIFRVFPKGMKIRLTFKKNQGLVHIKARLTNRFFFF